jgi:hypothetical protein
MSSVPSLCLFKIVELLGLGWSSCSVLFEGKAANPGDEDGHMSQCAACGRQVFPAPRESPVFFTGWWQKQFKVGWRAQPCSAC